MTGVQKRHSGLALSACLFKLFFLLDILQPFAITDNQTQEEKSQTKRGEMVRFAIYIFTQYFVYM